MYKLWYWALIERGEDEALIAYLPDMPDVTAVGRTEKDALTNLAALAANRVQQFVAEGQSPPRPSPASEISITGRSREINRALISVDMPRALARPSARYSVGG